VKPPLPDSGRTILSADWSDRRAPGGRAPADG